jgi:pyrimidine-specific ribonucleoside hydrolase
MQKKICLLILIMISIIQCGIASELPSQPMRNIIIDTDMGTDDVIAILYLLKRRDINIEAITIASDGDAHCRPAFANLQAILKLMHRHRIPVACGRETPLKSNHHFPDFVLKESDTLAGIAKTLPLEKNSKTGNAVKLLIKTLEASKTPIDILAIGPLTNIAEVIQQVPALKTHIRMIYLMGGAVHVPGNIIDVNPKLKNKMAEWNIYLDPDAAAIVFRSGIPITLIPLDITNQIPVTKEFYLKVKQKHNTLASNMLFEIVKNNKELIKHKQWYFWDPLAAVISSDETFSAFKMENLRVILQPELESGATVIDNTNGAPIRVLNNVSKNQFEKTMLETLWAD